MHDSLGGRKVETVTVFKETGKVKIVLVGILIGLLCVGSVYGQQKGTAAEAKALLSHAVAYYKVNGRDKAFAAFNDTKGRFVHSDLYIYAVDPDGKVLSHGADAKLIGENLLDLKDAAGKRFIKAIIDVTKINNKGVMDYKWTNPKTKKIEQKSSFFERVGDVIFICGYYE